MNKRKIDDEIKKISFICRSEMIPKLSNSLQCHWNYAITGCTSKHKN